MAVLLPEGLYGTYVYAPPLGSNEVVGVEEGTAEASVVVAGTSPALPESVAEGAADASIVEEGTSPALPESVAVGTAAVSTVAVGTSPAIPEFTAEETAADEAGYPVLSTAEPPEGVGETVEALSED